METRSAKNSEQKVITARPVMDISKLICIQPGAGINPTHVIPFIMCRTRGHVSDLYVHLCVRWLQYSKNETPDETEMKTYRPASKLQTTDRFTELPRVSYVGATVMIYDAVADRDGGVIGVAKLHWLPGCLWTTLF